MSDWRDRPESEVVLPKPRAGVRDNYQGPTKYLAEYLVVTKREGQTFAPRVSAFFTEWEREARDNARHRAEANNLPIYEISPLDDPDIVLQHAPDGVFVIHQCRIEFGQVVRDPDKVRFVYRHGRLDRIKQHAPPRIE